MITTPARDTVAATLPYALQALAAHMTERGLASVLDIRVPRGDERHLVVTVASYAIDSWVGGDFAVDKVDVRPVNHSGPALGYEWVSYDGWLPDMGVRVRIECLRRIVEAVSA